MNRRRFLAISAAALAMPRTACAETVVWEGTGLGAALSVRLTGDNTHAARRALDRIAGLVARVEDTASLFRDSALTRLNRDGRLAHPDTGFLFLLRLAARVHAATGGAFDPTVQPLWTATATGGDTVAAARAVGWDRIRIGPDELRLERGMALTLNGIAQGWAADLAADMLRAAGFGDVLVDMGEIAALGLNVDRPWTVGIADTQGRQVGSLPLRDRAVATSSPGGTRIGDGRPHILHPTRQPLWDTISVSARSAALADALSTAFCLMTHDEIGAALAAFPDARLETAIRSAPCDKTACRTPALDFR
jgi:thiamine biosynthesis lipoprotein